MIIRTARIAVAVYLTLLVCYMPVPADANPLFILFTAEAIRVADCADRLHEWHGQYPRQSSEFTCGPAALALLFNHYLGDSTSEEEMCELSGTLEGGASLYGLRNACRAKGYDAQGYKEMTYERLLRETKNGVPVVVHFTDEHFTLAVAAVGDYVLLTDPALGSISMHKTDFLRKWSRYALVIKPKKQVDDTSLREQIQSTNTRLNTLDRTSRLMMWHR